MFFRIRFLNVYLASFSLCALAASAQEAASVSADASDIVPATTENSSLEEAQKEARKLRSALQKSTEQNAALTEALTILQTEKEAKAQKEAEAAAKKKEEEAAKKKEEEAAKKKEEEAAKKKEEKEAAAQKKGESPQQGFNWRLKLGANASFLHSQKVVGQQDGLTLSVGGVVDAGMLYLRGSHRWESKLNVQHLQTLTPQLPVPVKAVDLVDASTEYRWALPFARWIGPYARAQAVSAALPGQLVNSKEMQVQRILRDGSTENEVASLNNLGISSIGLTNFFEPLVLNENAGINLLALEKKWLTLKSRLGVGGQHVLVQDGFVVQSIDGNNAVLKQLGISNSAGVNADFEAVGDVWKDSISYSLVARFYYPILTLESSDLNAFDRLNADITGSISFKVNNIMSINYVLTIKRVPTVLNDLQIQNALLLNFALQVL